MNRCIEFDLKNYRKSIYELSFDKEKKESLCPYANKFLDFEEIVKIKQSRELPKAVDLFFIDDEKKEVWFVEFKNQDKNKVKKFEVKRKILDSLISFYELFDEEIRCKYKKNYFVVYKCSDNIFEELYNEFEDREIYFEIEEIKNKFLDDAYTDCCETFLNFFKKNFNIKWQKKE